MLGDRQVGPMTLEELADLGIRPDTYIWCKGMPDWERADENGDVCRFFRQRLAELRHPSPKASLPTTSASADNETMDATRQRDDSYDAVPPAFRYYFRKGDVPAPEKADHDPADHDPSVPPPSGLLFFATVVTVLCFFPTGIMAIYCSRPQGMGRIKQKRIEVVQPPVLGSGTRASARHHGRLCAQKQDVDRHHPVCRTDIICSNFL